jgi:hypothetical protein
MGPGLENEKGEAIFHPQVAIRCLASLLLRVPLHRKLVRVGPEMKRVVWQR